jgi:hypothetical protein
MAPDLHRRPLRGPSQIESLVWSEGAHLNNSSFVRISASRSERALIRGLTIRVLNFALAPSVLMFCAILRSTGQISLVVVVVIRSNRQIHFSPQYEKPPAELRTAWLDVAQNN